MKNDLNPIWLKAAVAGGLWASFEIIVGSLLHNLHLPFSGTLLATFSVILMIGFIQIWNTSGIIWRAGLICGLMKSLSPSAVILGPMTGIMMEAILMDLLIYLLGKNLIGYWIAGIAALLSTLLHKLVNLFILYGTDLVTIYLNMFHFIQKQFSLPDAEPKDLFIWILFLYILVGIVAATSGYLLGKYAINKRTETVISESPDEMKVTNWDQADPDQRFTLALFFLHLLLIPGMLFLINRFGLHPYSLVPAGGYILFLLLHYPKIMGRLKRPFFWSQLVILTLVAGIFWHPVEANQSDMTNGFLIGLEMCLRAILIVSAFSGLSVEIRNPRIIRFLIGRGFGNAYAAISLAFQSLPALLDRSSQLKTMLRHPARTISSLLQEAQQRYLQYEERYGM